MILLRIPPLPRRQYLRDDTAFPPLLVDLLSHLARLLLLLRVMEENRRSVLTPHIRPLAIRSRRVMHFVEEFEKRGISDLLRIVMDLQRFGICNRQHSPDNAIFEALDKHTSRPSTTHSPIPRIL